MHRFFFVFRLPERLKINLVCHCEPDESQAWQSSKKIVDFFTNAAYRCNDKVRKQFKAT